MFCGKCGAENVNSAKFCRNCGEPLKSMCGVQETNCVREANSAQEEKKAVFPQAGMVQAAGQPDRKTRAIPKKALAGICAVVAVLIVIICMVVNAKPTINLNDYLIIETEGYDGYGTATASIDWDAVEEKYGEKVSFTSNFKSTHDSLDNLLSPVAGLQYYVNVKLDRSDELSNGDKITYTWQVDEEYAANVKCRMKCEDGTYDISGLTEVGSFDAFADLEVTFSGIAPDGTADVNYYGTKLSSYDFTCDKYSDLSNGDTVKVSIVNADPEYYAKYCGMIPEAFEKEYTVEGLSSYVAKLSEISTEMLAPMQQQASDQYQAYVAREWSEDDAALLEFNYIGDYLLTKKESDWGNNNILYLVYKAQVQNSCANEDEAYNKVNSIYWYIAFKDLILGTDGKLTADIADYSTPNIEFTVDSGVSSGWFSTYSWHYEGYESLDKLYKDVVTSNMDEYNHEDNVDESIAPAVQRDESLFAVNDGAEEKEGASNQGYIFPNSDKELLTEADLEGLSAEECKRARNEIYARHGRKFKDEEVQAYFEAFDWYEGVIEPDDFEEDMLSEIEKANRDLIVAYEEKNSFY